METENVTTKFKVDISDLKQNIAEANRQVKLYRAELNNASAGMQKGTESADSLSRKIEAQSKIVDAEKQKLEAMRQELARYEERVQQGRTVVEDLTRKHEEAAAAFGKDSEEAKKLAEQLKKAQEAQERNEKAADNLRVSIVNQDTAVKNAEGKVQQYTSQLQQMDDEQKNANEQMQKTTEGGLHAFSVALGELAADVIKQATEDLKELVTSVVDVGKTFDTSLSKVKAISGATEDETEQLKEMAEELGRTTKYTAAQVADGMSYMAMAGWKTKDILRNIAPVLELATASGEELALTSDIVTDALTAFGLKSEDTQYFVDVLAQTAANANTNVSLMGETFKYCAPLAGALGYSLEDMSWAIGLMASQGIKASQAGTSMRRMLGDLTGDITISGKETGDMIVKTENADGSMRELYDIVKDLRFAFSQLTEAERVNQAKALVGQNAMSGFLALMNATEEDAQKMRTALDRSGGAAKQMAETMQDNLGGKMVELDSAMDGFKKKVYEGMVDPLTDLVVLVTERVVPELNELADDFAAWMADFEEENGTIKENVEAFLDTAIPAAKEFLQWVKDNGPEIKSTLTGIVAAIAAFKAVTMIQAAVTAFQALATVIELVGIKQAALNLIMAANPVGLIIAAVVGLAALLISLYKNNDDFREAVDLWGESLLETFDMWGQRLAEFWDNVKVGWGVIKDGAVKAWDWIKERWDDLKTGWIQIAKGWTDFWDNVRTGWGDIFSGVIDYLNNIINLLNKIPGVDIPEIGAADVFAPKMARGGIVDRPTLAQVGEAGSEAIVPLEGDRNGLRKIAGLLRQEMGAPAPASVQGGTNVSLTQNISSPKALSEYEIWRQTKNMLNLFKTKGV